MARNKLEPLKNKKLILCDFSSIGIITKYDSFLKEDVASAVEYLKRELLKVYPEHELTVLFKKINRAFSDVCESGSGEVKQ